LCWPEGHRFAGQPIRLRDDQVEVVNKFLENPQCIQEIATGFGKTITTATLAKICEKYGRTITIVPNKSLVEQTEEDFINCQLDVGVYYGDRKDLNKTHTICTWQSLNILDKKSQDNDELLSLAEFLEGVNTVMVDEVHMAKADVLKKLLTQNVSHAPIRWGLTGTVPKADIDFQNIRAALGEVVHQVKAHELQEKGVLSNCHVNIIQTAEWKEFGGYAEELKYLVTNKERVEFMASMISTIAETGNTLILVDRIETGKMLQEFLTTEGMPEVAFVSGAVKTTDRKVEYDEVKTATNKIIIATYGVAAVGINVPRIFNMVLIEPGKSFVRVIQSIGRGIRKADDKDFVQIWDFTAATKYAKRHLTERKRFYKEAKYPFTIDKVKY
jgi:superfamily II DNA or RNA helicase